MGRASIIAAVLLGACAGDSGFAFGDGGPDASYCEPGSVVACPLQDGVCAASTAICGPDGIVACGSEEYGARYELDETSCDGFDNDCDAALDEDASPACPLQEGVCGGSVRRCEGSTGLLPCDYFAHDARFEPLETACDGADNDCDGTIDEIPRSVGCPLTAGVCRGSRAACAGGSLRCAAEEYGPSFEEDETRCDALDNDCDGIVDEALVAPPCALTTGVCAGSRQRCRGDRGFVACQAAEYGASYEATETLCDGLDNDCDGMVDEAITRRCNRGCGDGVETCSDGSFVDCTRRRARSSRTSRSARARTSSSASTSKATW